MKIIFFFLIKAMAENVNSTIHNWMEFISNKAYTVRLRQQAAGEMYTVFSGWETVMDR